jgi:hypothetical protein
MGGLENVLYNVGNVSMSLLIINNLLNAGQSYGFLTDSTRIVASA